MSQISKTTASSRPSFMEVVNRLTKMTSTATGVDAAFMLPQYASPVIIYLLLKISKARTFQTNLSTHRQQGLANLIAGIAKTQAGLSEARTLMRFFGMLPMIQWLYALHPRPLSALIRLLKSPQKLNLKDPKIITTIQCLSLMLYYPLEHLYYLANKGLIPISSSRAAKASLWSVRAWAIYVFLDIYKLAGTYATLQYRTKQLRSKKHVVESKEVEGYELQESSKDVAVAGENTSPTDLAVSEERAKLKSDWNDWKLATIKNAGWAPLTIHWSVIGGLWQEPAITGVLGLLPVYVKLVSVWRGTKA